MKEILWQGIWFLLVFFVMFLVYFILLKRKMKKNKLQTVGEFSYLIHHYELDVKKINYQHLAMVVSLMNAFIVAFVSTFIMLIPTNMIWRLLIAFVLLFLLIYALYEIYGRYLKKKYGK